MNNYYNATLHEIEVFNGSIYIDGTDIELDSKLKKMESKVKQAQAMLDRSNANNEEEQLQALKQFIYEAIDAIELLFGVGSADKIFPIKSYSAVMMFLEALPQELTKLGVKTEQFYKERTSPEKRAKYEPKVKKDETHREL